MKKLLASVAFAVTLLLPHATFAQSSPGLTYGQVPTAGQWNSYFAAKQDVLGFIPLSTAGGTMTGRLTTAASTALTTGFNIPPGIAPSLPNNGDIWETTAGIFAQVNGVTIGPLSGPSGASFTATAPLAVTFPGSGITNFALNFNSSLINSSGSLGINLANANTFSATQTAPTFAATNSLTVNNASQAILGLTSGTSTASFYAAPGAAYIGSTSTNPLTFLTNNITRGAIAGTASDWTFGVAGGSNAGSLSLAGSGTGTSKIVAQAAASGVSTLPTGTGTLANSATAPLVLNATTGALTCPTCASATLNTGALTSANDTNVTLTLGGSPSTALLNASSLTLGWTGTLAAGRLNSNVVQGVTNDANITGAIAAQNLTLGWTGTLAAARLNSNVVQSVANDTNVTGAIAAQGLTLGWSGTLGLARGGTAAALTASNGGVFYSTASSGAILAGTATAGLPLLSGASGAPAWGAFSLPASVVSGGIPYFSSTSAQASSALLVANALVVGGGAGAAPATLASLGTTTTVMHGNASGPPSFGSIVAGDIAANAVGNAQAAQMAAWTLKGNVSGATANAADFTIGGLTNKSSPAGTDLVLIQDQAAAGAYKYSTLAQVVGAVATGVSSFNTRIGAVVAAVGDYSFSMISGLLNLATQVSGVLLPANGGVPQSLTTYTPTIACGSGSGTFSATGDYEIIGKKVLLNININVTAIGTCAAFLKTSVPVVNTAAQSVLTGITTSTGVVQEATVQGSGTGITSARFDNLAIGFTTGDVVTFSGHYNIP